MATDASIGRRRALALQRIIGQLVEGLALPTVSRHGPEFLMMLQLEAIADYLEHNMVAAEVASELHEPATMNALVEAFDYSALTVAQLRQLAAGRGVDLGTAKNKSDIIAALEAAGDEA